MVDRIVIERTEKDLVADCWFYLLSDGTVVKGRPGDARIPAGMEYSERNQWATNRIHGIC